MADKMCNACSDKIVVPFLVHEGAMVRAERDRKRNWVLIIILIAALVLSNVAWLIAWNQYDYYGSEATEITEYTQDGQGTNIIGDNNEVTNGAETDN